MLAAVFLDRDNTLIRNDGDLGDPDKVELVQGAAAAIASLRGLGYSVVVVTNQGGVARGKYEESDVEAVNQRINSLLKANSGARIDRFYYCPYHPEATVERYRREHPWRKPAPGMLLQAREDLRLDMGESWMIGDQMRDVEAGAAAGVRTILLSAEAEPTMPPQKDQIRPARAGRSGPAPTFSARNLVEAVRVIAQQRKPELYEHMPDPAERQRLQRSRVQETRRQVTPIRLGEVADDAAPPDAERPQPPRQRRPFRPWDAPASASRSVDPVEPTPAPRKRPVEEPVLPEPEPTATIEEILQLEPETPEAEQPVPAEPVDEQPEAPVADVRQDEPDDQSTNKSLLRQILHELRSQRGVGGDFSYARMLAVILQLIAVVCFIGAFTVSGDEQDVFVRWMGSAVLIQLATLTTLLFRR